MRVLRCRTYDKGLVGLKGDVLTYHLVDNSRIRAMLEPSMQCFKCCIIAKCFKYDRAVVLVAYPSNKR